MAALENNNCPDIKADLSALLKTARTLYSDGKVNEAASACRQIIAIQPAHVQALHLGAVIAHRLGYSADAAAMLQRAVESAPTDLNLLKNLILILTELNQMDIAAGYCPAVLSCEGGDSSVYKGLGDLFSAHGYLLEAESLYRKSISKRGDLGAAWACLGGVLHRLNRVEEAIECYSNALPLDPGNAEIYFGLGNAFSAIELFDNAVSSYEKALVLQPDHLQAAFNMGNALKAQQNYEAAAACYEKCIRIDPEDIDVRYNLANTRYAQGRIEDAIRAYEEALRIQPEHVPALNNLGCLLKELGADAQALDLFKRSTRIDPGYITAYLNLGNFYKDRNDFENAHHFLSKAISLDPANQESLVCMGRLLKREGRFDEGMTLLKRAVDAGPGISNAWWYYFLSLPVIYQDADEIDRRRRQFALRMDALIDSVALDTIADRKRALAGIGSITNFYLQYQGRNDLELQTRYGGFVNRVMGANFPQYNVVRSMPTVEADEKIRIGYVSSFMRAHTVGHFLRGWLENQDRSKFTVHCYYIDRPTDALTDRFKQICDRFHQIPGNIEAAARQIVNDNLHILVFTDIGMFAAATQLAGLRLAPIQCKGWGHPVTTGLPTINYYLSSDLMEAEDADEHYSETLIRLPNLALALEKPDIPTGGKTRPEFGLSADDFVFLTSQSLFKYLPQYDIVYPRIAARVPDAKFVFISNPSEGITRRFKGRLSKAFNEHGLSLEQFCVFQPRLSPDDFLRLNRISDVLLDPFDWSGGKTTLEAVSCGLPVVTCPGAFMRGRHAYAMLKMMGIEDTIAADLQDYVTIAGRLGSDDRFYRRMREAIAARRHVLFNDTTTIRALEDFYRRVVKQRLNEQGRRGLE